MCARLAVLLTEHATKHAHPDRASRAEGSLPTAPFPRPPHPTPLLFRPHLVRLSPLPATLRGHPASVANKRLTTGLTLLDATLTKSQWRGYSRKPMSPKSLRHNPFADPHPLTHVGSILCKNGGGEGEASHWYGLGGSLTKQTGRIPDTVNKWQGRVEPSACHGKRAVLWKKSFALYCSMTRVNTL